MKVLPTVFLSHGSPMNAVEPGIAGPAWEALGKTLPRPEAILMVSAHWETSLPMLTGHAKPETIHDFGGFPPELYTLRYPAPGAPALATRAVALLKEARITAGIDGARGLDHGAWVPLRYAYPQAEVPVVQLSVQPGRDTAHHLAVGRALAPLTREGILIVGSGHTTHNLRDWMAQRTGSTPLPYAQAFASWLKVKLREHDMRALLAYRDEAPGAARAHPTEEHFLPLFVALGAAGEGATTESILTGFEAPSLALDSYLFRPAAVAGEALQATG